MVPRSPSLQAGLPPWQLAGLALDVVGRGGIALRGGRLLSWSSGSSLTLEVDGEVLEANAWEELALAIILFLPGEEGGALDGPAAVEEGGALEAVPDDVDGPPFLASEAFKRRLTSCSCGPSRQGSLLEAPWTSFSNLFLSLCWSPRGSRR
jgi:hypothetical protein